MCARYRWPKKVAVLVLIGTLGANITMAGGFGIHIGGSVGKALKKADREKNRAGKRFEEGVRVAGKTAERQLHAVGETAEGTGKRLREGKPLAAMGYLATEPLKRTGKNVLRATQESSMLRMGGQIVATTFVPGGAFVYSAWYAGCSTDDVGAGLRAGLISGTASALFSQIGSGPTPSFADAAGRAIGSATAGCVATKAAHGDCEDGAKSAALASIAASTYQRYTGLVPDPRPGSEPVSKAETIDGCAETAGCKVVTTSDDMRAVVQAQSPAPNSLGKFSRDVGTPVDLQHEGSIVMRFVNGFPGTNASAIPHDLWALDASMNDFVLKATIPFAFVYTYTALGAGRDQQLLKSVAANGKK